MNEDSADSEGKPGTNPELQRFLAGFIAAGCAITFMLPIGGMYHAAGGRADYLAAAVPPAALAWLLLWALPGSAGMRMFRTAMAAIGLVGAGGFVLRAFPGMMNPAPWMVETMAARQFVPEAFVYIGIGVLGFIGSFLFGGED
jgi:hypothetical protein